MTTYVALLRGINVGRHQQIAMADLRATCERLGYRQVRTHLRTGNVVFTAAAGGGADVLAREIEGAIRADLGRTVACLIRTAGELQAVIDVDPFAGVVTQDSKLAKAFLGKPSTAVATTRNWNTVRRLALAATG